ncbi:MAG TPA: YihY/virulence factor BrkB family protein [Gemmatimonadales bacterium]|jgi:membrane protein|nr:YihY/virulence factor BrkB family protein [Gemmatimonadales bacterium]
MKARDLGWILRRTVAGWWNDNVPRLGASLAYYTLFALAPILIVAITVAGFFFGAEAVQREVTGQIGGLVGPQGGRAVQAMLEAASQRTGNGLATGIGLVTFFLGATGAFLELQTALNGIWRVKPRADAGLKDMLLQRLLSFGLVIGVGFVLLVSLLVSAALSALNRYIGAFVPEVAVLWQGVNTLVSLGVVTLLFAMIFQFLPDADLRLRDVWMGALVTAGLFTVGKFAIGLYLGTSDVASTYGAAGSVVVLLIWVYYSSQIVLLGAEFTRAYVERFGGRPPPSEHATRDPAPEAVGGKREPRER